MTQENTATLCSDGIDNDGDGQIDCEDSECLSFNPNSCDICSEGISFADYLIDYRSGCSFADPMPEAALGLADYGGQVGDQPEIVFLGDAGSIKLGFSNNLVTNSGDDEFDIWVFEAGTLVEAITIGLRPKGDETIDILEQNNFRDDDGDGFYTMIDLGGALSAVDIDDLIPGQPAETLLFDAIEITDIEDFGCIGSNPGADIDAVCAIYYVETDCNCIPNGTAVIDECGNCLEPTDPQFNMECMDCNGNPDGTAVIDDCGECLEPTDPSFNTSCLDCNGVVNGVSVVDDCGECFEPSDPNFNMSCADCAGIPNGMAVLDDCGECLEPNSLDFNQSCLDCNGVVNGLSVLDDCGECLEPTDPDFNMTCLDCNGEINGSAEFDDCGVCLDFNDPDFNQSCVDCAGVPNGLWQIDDCGNCLEPTDPNFKVVCNSVKDIYIPNVISHGTITDSEFVIFPKDISQILSIPVFSIYDRWGNLVYSQSISDLQNFSNWWDGTKDGQPLASGCYVYRIQVTYVDQTVENFVGDITLLK